MHSSIFCAEYQDKGIIHRFNHRLVDSIFKVATKNNPIMIIIDQMMLKDERAENLKKLEKTKEG